MNRNRLIIILITLNFFIFNLFAQDSKPILVDEYQLTNNGTVQAKVDSFLIALQNNPEAKGYVLSFASDQSIKWNERVIREHLEMRRFPLKRIEFLNGESRNPRFQLWLVPKGVSPPSLEIKPGDPDFVDECPVFTIIEPGSITESGGKMMFAVETKTAKYMESSTFNWSIDRGTIISGQGTSKITVDTEGVDEGVMTATVDIEGDFICDINLGGTGIVASTPKAELIDRFVRGNCEDVLARMDSLLIGIQNNPSSTAYIF